MKYLIILVLFLSWGSVSAAETKGKRKRVKYRKVQKVDFDGSSVDGQARNPTGAYLVQKRGINFAPMYNVKENFDDSIKESVEYVE